MADRTGARPVIVIGGPPTSNGDLHVGHVAGPYVGGDVYVRYQRARGNDVVFASGTDDAQTYVVTSAARLRTTPAELVARSTGQIKSTFDAMGVSLDGFAPTDDGYMSTVYDYVTRLYDLGKFRMRRVRLPYSQRTGSFLVEGLVGGDCPTCLADSRGSMCEACGCWIDFDGLLNPYSIVDRADPVTYREADILVFPLEEYRERLIAYHEANASTWRPHVVQLMRELLANPLPDFPITYPLSYGWPAPFTETPGQVLNAWLDGMPASMYCTTYAQRQMGFDPPTNDDAWRAEHNAKLVFFVGFDNLFIWALVHIAELMAHEGRYVLPHQIPCNEFFELENEKFSTSKGHVVWARDLVGEVSRDVVRFYLNLSAPEHSRTNFSRAALDKIGSERLVEPWNALAATLDKLTADIGDGTALPVSPAGPARAAAIVSRFANCFELDSFSLSRAADLVALYTDQLRAQAASLAADGPDRAQLGDVFLQLRALLSGASPILIDLAARATADGLELSFAPEAYRVTSTTTFAVPTLDMLVDPVITPDLLSIATTTV